MLCRKLILRRWLRGTDGCKEDGLLPPLYTRHQVAGPFLIVAPLSTLQHWYREVCTQIDLDP